MAVSRKRGLSIELCLDHTTDSLIMVLVLLQFFHGNSSFSGVFSDNAMVEQKISLSSLDNQHSKSKSAFLISFVIWVRFFWTSACMVDLRTSMENNTAERD